MLSLQEEKIIAPIFFKEYINGNFRLNIGYYDYPLLLSSTNIIYYKDNINELKDINNSHLNLILDSDPEIIIIGTGQTQMIPVVNIIEELARNGKSVEFMTTEAACKTYNILVNENRKVSCIVI